MTAFYMFSYKSVQAILVDYDCIHMLLLGVKFQFISFSPTKLVTVLFVFH